MRAKLNQNFKILFLLSFCMLFFLKSFTSISFSKFESQNILIESAEESESETNEKLTEGAVEWEDFNNHSISVPLVNLNENFRFLFFKLHLPFSYIEGIDLPPEA